MISTIVYYTLEILLGIVTWTVVKSSQGIYYLVYGSSQNKVAIPEEKINDKEYIKKLIEENNELREKIKKQDNEKFVVINYSDSCQK